MSGDEQYNPCLNHGIRRCTICIANPVGYVTLDEVDDVPCDMRCGQPYDFAWCETHDTTFALGDVCRYHKRRRS